MNGFKCTSSLLRKLEDVNKRNSMLDIPKSLKYFCNVIANFEIAI